MLTNEKLDQDPEDGIALPITARTEAEASAERKFGPDWRSKRLDAHFAALIVPAPDVVDIRERFARWYIMLTAPNREQKAAERLERLHVPIYLPMFTKQVNGRGRLHLPRLCAVIPGMLLAPCEIASLDNRDDALEWAGVLDFIRTGDGLPYVTTKDDVERIRIMEAKLNLPPEAKGVLFKVGQAVRFKSDFSFWGKGTIFEIASEARIGLWVERLFGRTCKVYAPASEIEAM